MVTCEMQEPPPCNLTTGRRHASDASAPRPTLSARFMLMPTKREPQSTPFSQIDAWLGSSAASRTNASTLCGRPVPTPKAPLCRNRGWLLIFASACAWLRPRACHAPSLFSARPRPEVVSSFARSSHQPSEKSRRSGVCARPTLTVLRS